MALNDAPRLIQIKCPPHVHNVKIMTLSAQIKTLVLCFIPVAFLASCVIVWPDNSLDWDMQRYITQVKLSGTGDHSFSYQHNLLKTWLYNASKLVQLLTGEFSPLFGARLLTICAATLASFFAALTTLSITRSLFVSVLAGWLWFLLPGNVLMMTNLEDNAWSNAFNAAFLFALCSASSVTLPFAGERKRRPIIWSAVAGAILAIGINIHQQLALLFWAFIGLIVFSYDADQPPAKRVGRVAFAVITFIAVYAGLSFIQNKLVFDSWEVKASLIRLYDQPYAKTYPNLWFFTADESIADWLGRITLGWRRLLMLSASAPLVFYYIAAPILGASVALLLVISRWRGTLLFLCETRTLLWLCAVCAVFIPYSLLYEPENPERWDSILPGLIVLACVLFFYSYKRIPANIYIHPRFVRDIAIRDVFAALLVASLLGSTVQVYFYVSKAHAGFISGRPVKEVTAMLEHLSKTSDVSEDHVVLCSQALIESDVQIRLSYYFPRVTVITLDKKLRPLYTSHSLQLRPDIAGDALANMNFGTNAHFSAADDVYQSVQAHMPEFLAQHQVDKVMSQ